PDLGGQDGLGRRERQRHVDGDVSLYQAPAGLQAVGGHGDLNDRVGGDLGQLETLLEDLVGLLGRRLEGHRPVDLGTQLLHVGLDVARLLPRDQAWVRREPAEHSPFLDLPDLFEVRGIQEQLHVLLASSWFGRFPPWPPDDPSRRRSRRRSVARSTTRSITADRDWSRL